MLTAKHSVPVTPLIPGLPGTAGLPVDPQLKRRRHGRSSRRRPQVRTSSSAVAAGRNLTTPKVPSFASPTSTSSLLQNDRPGKGTRQPGQSQQLRAHLPAGPSCQGVLLPPEAAGRPGQFPALRPVLPDPGQLHNKGWSPYWHLPALDSGCSQTKG